MTRVCHPAYLIWQIPTQDAFPDATPKGSIFDRRWKGSQKTTNTSGFHWTLCPFFLFCICLQKCAGYLWHFPLFLSRVPFLLLFNKSACWDCYTAVKLSHKKITRASQKETNTPLFSTISFRTTEAMQKWNLPSLYCISPGHTHRHKNHSLSLISFPFVKQSDRKSNPQRIGTEISPLWICSIGVFYWVWADNRTEQ